MTVLLVLFTLIAFLVADLLVQRRAQRKLGKVAIRSMQLPSLAQWQLSDDILLAPNHVWMRREQNGSVTVGLDNFLLGLTGMVEKIGLPNEGEIVGRGTPAINLQEKNKTLRLHSPIEGQVLKVNRQVLDAPMLVTSNPYTSGWLFNFIPSDTAKSLTGFLRGQAAIEWLKKQNELVKDFLRSQQPQLRFATMQDGGVPIDGILKGFDKDVWNEFQEKFISQPNGSGAASIGEYDNA